MMSAKRRRGARPEIPLFLQAARCSGALSAGRELDFLA